MLIITRRVGETIVVGQEGHVAVTVMSIKNGEEIKLGFSAPPDMDIHTEEQRKKVMAALEKDKKRGRKSKE
jgi:carbon storage regulator CsrA